MDLKVGVKLLKWNEKSETSYRRRPESEMGESFKLTSKQNQCKTKIGHLAYKHPFVALYLVIYSTLPAYMLTFQLFLESRGCEIMFESGEHMPTCPCSYARVGLHKMSTDIKWSSNLEIILFRQHFKNFYWGIWISNIFLEYLLLFYDYNFDNNIVISL